MRYTMPARRPFLRALLGAVASAVPALSALAQGATSAQAEGGRGSASSERQRFGSGPIGVALLVPPANGIYQRASRALIDGVRAAHARDGATVTVEVIEIDDDLITLRALYDELRERGFSMVLGPLTRDAVGLIADSGAPPVFTLTLNQIDGAALPANMLSFGLSAEAEARQAATIAWEEASATSRRPRAALVQDATPLGRRTAAAFAERWRALGGEVQDAVEVETAATARLRSQVSRLQADVYFVAADPLAAQAVRVSIGGRGVIYGTSRLNTGAVQPFDSGGPRYAIRSPELEGVRLIDMPWRVQPDHPAVMAYARPADLNAELQKLYALGIDAFRLARQLLDRAPTIDLDGVTGRLRFSPERSTIERDGVLAEYRDGVLVPLITQ